MILKTGKEFNRIRLETYPNYQGLVIEFQPMGDNAVEGSAVIEFTVGFYQLPNGNVGLLVQLPPEKTYQKGSTFVLLEDSLGSEKMTIQGVELKKVQT